MEAVKITNINNVNDNLLNEFMTFNLPFTWTVNSGTGSGVHSTEQFASGQRSLKITNSAYRTTDITISATGQTTGITLTDTKPTCISFKAYNPTQTAIEQTQLLTINIFKDASPYTTLDFTVDEFDKWVQYGQYLILDAGVYTYTITQKFDGTSSLFSCYIYVDDFKHEIDNENIGEPTAYVVPSESLNKGGGWGYYVDSLATPTISVGTTFTQITIDALGSNITDYLPEQIRGVSELFSSNKITPINVGDDYDGRLDINVTSKTGSPNWIQLIVDISDATAGDNVVFTGYIQTAGTAPYKQSIILDLFSLGTFITNGGKLFMRTDTGSVTIGTRNLKLSRKSK
jgi:hypothetical protein